jgi:hypothetical protein
MTQTKKFKFNNSNSAIKIQYFKLTERYFHRNFQNLNNNFRIKLKIKNIEILFKNNKIHLIIFKNYNDFSENFSIFSSKYFLELNILLLQLLKF